MILHEKHTKNGNVAWNHFHWTTCRCSYCMGQTKLHYGLNIPKSFKWNSWFVIKYWNHRYIRFTLPFLPKHKS